MSPRAWEELKSFFTTLIGNTADIGGTAVAGSLTAKANAILSGQAKQAQQETVQDILSKLNTSGAITVNAVKSIQRGVIRISGSERTATASISPVNMNKSIVLFSGFESGFGSSLMAIDTIGLTLIDSTTVQISRGAGSGYQPNSFGCASYQVVEFY